MLCNTIESAVYNLPNLKGLCLSLTCLVSSSDSVLASDVVITRMGTCLVTFSLTVSDKSALVWVELGIEGCTWLLAVRP